MSASDIPNIPLSAWLVPFARSLTGAPQYQHSACSSCIFLGRLHTADLYCRPKQDSFGTTYMVRYSSDGQDYYSNNDFRNREYSAQSKKYDTSEWSVNKRKLFLYRMVLFALCPVALLNLIHEEPAKVPA